ncbi:hypothetical protein [Deinococcus roseus]|uniref:GtrA-like protein domain-containing protein n=1 Tax=Deinococcus roseus TaxID=392414 RepID=A0ABQ2D6W0_9DEIO|nr:hypothetical protein [Deinococcus roseus]GGJ47985.1 hypothetical protein GCM10008938_37510 [Deinococcus roseus]
MLSKLRNLPFRVQAMSFTQLFHAGLGCVTVYGTTMYLSALLKAGGADPAISAAVLPVALAFLFNWCACYGARRLAEWIHQQDWSKERRFFWSCVTGSILLASSVGLLVLLLALAFFGLVWMAAVAPAAGLLMLLVVLLYGRVALPFGIRLFQELD